MAVRNAELAEPGASLGGRMGVIYVARSAKFSKWASDAGVTKNVFKIGYSENDPAPLIAAGWGGETDWTLVKQRAAEGVTEEEIIAHRDVGAGARYNGGHSLAICSAVPRR